MKRMAKGHIYQPQKAFILPVFCAFIEVPIYIYGKLQVYQMHVYSNNKVRSLLNVH